VLNELMHSLVISVSRFAVHSFYYLSVSAFTVGVNATSKFDSVPVFVLCSLISNLISAVSPPLQRTSLLNVLCSVCSLGIPVVFSNSESRDWRCPNSKILALQKNLLRQYFFEAE